MKICYQGEPAECGLACFVMISQSQGVDIDLATVREDIQPTSFGVSIADLKALGAKYGVNLESIQFHLHDLSLLPIPTILHQNSGHFVVLEKVSKGCSIVLNPALGRQVVDNTFLMQGISGYALILNDAQESQSGQQIKHAEAKLETKFKIYKFLDIVKKNILDLKLKNDYLLIFLLLLSVFLGTIIPISAFQSPEKILQNADLDYRYFFLFIGFTLFSVFLSYISSLIKLKMMGFGYYHNGKKIYEKMLSNDILFFERRNGIDIVNRLWRYIGTRGKLSVLASEITSSMIVALLSLIFMIYIDPVLSLVVVSCILLNVVNSNFARNKTQELQHVEMKMVESIDRHLIESYHGVDAIKSSNSISRLSSLFERRLIAYALFKKNEFKKLFVYSTLSQLIETIEQVFILSWFYVMITNGTAHVGEAFLFLFVKGVVTSSFESVIVDFIATGEMKVDLERVDDIKKFSSSQYLNNATDVEFNELSVSDLIFYKKNSGNTSHIEYPNFTINDGECLLLKSASGVGKTTLLKILSGNYRKYDGEILINGQVSDSRRLKEYTYYHSSNQKFFSGTIFENLTLFSEDISVSKVIEILKYFELWELVDAQPDSLNTEISEDVSPFSSGEKQRLLLCRAFLSSKPLLLLDEPTSHLDESYSLMVFSKIVNAKRTILLATHNYSILHTGMRVLTLIQKSTKKGDFVEDECLD